MTSAAPAAAPTRLASLDVFRGLTIAFMVLVNNPGGPAYAPLKHAAWHGWTLTDLVFPFFLFIVGVATPFSLAARGIDASRRALLARIWARALALFMIGQMLPAMPMPLSLSLSQPGPHGFVAPGGFLAFKGLRAFAAIFVWGGIVALLWPWRSRFVSTWLPVAVCVGFYLLLVATHHANLAVLRHGWPADVGFGGGIYNPTKLRVPGVLQRIGICYGVVATIALFAGRRGIVLAIVALFAAYSVVMLRVELPGHATGSLAEADNVARRVDEAVFDRSHLDAGGRRVHTQRHTYAAYPDPEGLLSTLPAIGGTLIGVLAGRWLREPRSAGRRCAGLLVAAVPVTLLGVALDRFLMPINKSLWTPSFAVLASGLALGLLGAIFWLCDVRGWRRWAIVLTIFGTNAIAAFVASSFVLRISRLLAVPDVAVDPKTGRVPLVAPHTWVNHALGRLIDDPQLASLAYALAFVTVIFAIVGLLYARRIFLKV